MQPPIPAPQPAPDPPKPSGLSNFVATTRKALTAGLAAGVAAYGTAVTDGSVSSAEWAIIAGAVVTAAVSVYLVRNRT